MEQALQQAQEVPESILAVLDSVEDPDTGGGLLQMGMLQDLKLDGKTLSMKLIPPDMACGACGSIGTMVKEIEQKLAAQGYSVNVDVQQRTWKLGHG